MTAASAGQTPSLLGSTVHSSGKTSIPTNDTAGRQKTRQLALGGWRLFCRFGTYPASVHPTEREMEQKDSSGIIIRKVIFGMGFFMEERISESKSLGLNMTFFIFLGTQFISHLHFYSCFQNNSWNILISVVEGKKVEGGEGGQAFIPLVLSGN